MKENSLNNRKIYISFLKVICCFGVTVIHTNMIFWCRPHGRVWVYANFFETFFYYAVPIFFMIAGATSLDYREKYTTKVFLKKRITKIFFPFIFWSLIAGLFMAKLEGHPFDWNIFHIINSIFTSNYFGVYWFLITMLELYLSFPLLSAVNDKIKIYSYTVVIGVVFVGTIPLILKIFHIGTWSILPPVVSGYLIFVLLGYVLDHISIEKKYRIGIYILGFLGWLTHFLGTIYLSYGTDEIVDTFKGYLNLPAILQTVAVFVFFKHIDYQKLLKNRYVTFEKIVNQLASYTFGVYLLHLFPINYLPVKFQIDVSTLTWQCGGSVAIFLGCIVVVAIIKKIPFVNKLLP